MELSSPCKLSESRRLVRGGRGAATESHSGAEAPIGVCIAEVSHARYASTDRPVIMAEGLSEPGERPYHTASRVVPRSNFVPEVC